MTPHQLHEHLVTLLVNKGLNAVALTNEAHFNRDLGLDSLDVIDVLLDVEIRFGIQIPDEDWRLLQTVGQLKVYLAGAVLFDQPDWPVPQRSVYETPVGANAP